LSRRSVAIQERFSVIIAEVWNRLGQGSDAFFVGFQSKQFLLTLHAQGFTQQMYGMDAGSDRGRAKVEALRKNFSIGTVAAQAIHESMAVVSQCSTRFRCWYAHWPTASISHAVDGGAVCAFPHLATSLSSVVCCKITAVAVKILDKRRFCCYQLHGLTTGAPNFPDAIYHLW